MMIRYRKNSSFFKNAHGAHIADIILSLIETCRMNRQNPVDYLMALMKNKHQVFANPEQWMPWNYLDNFESDACQSSSDPPPIFRNSGGSRISIPQ
ncbi:MAG: transposase domain-containing protein [Candidatus Brocadiales bacterium]|nr:transposase domain-containing protein [Candidatus Brocadiales bacterium]